MDVVCSWECTDGDFNLWEGSCGMMWVLNNDGTPATNEMIFCPKCGRKILTEEGV